MTPIFTLSSLRFLGLLLWLFFRLFFLFLARFERFQQFHRACEHAGEQSAAEQVVAEKFPRLRPSRGAFGERNQPARERLGVLRIVKWIEEPRKRVGDEIKQHCPDQSARKQGKK